MKRRAYVVAALADIRAEFQNGRIVEARLRSARPEVLNGVMVKDDPTGTVIVDPAPSTVETLFHELLHRKHPRWGEKRVERTANHAMIALTTAERRRWYQQYKRAAKKVRMTVTVPK